MSAASGYPLLVEDFSPGFHAATVSNRLPPGATPDAKNAWFHQVGFTPKRATMGRRPGDRLINPTAMSLGDRVEALFEFRQRGANPKLLAICDGLLYAFDGIDAFVAQTIAIWTPGEPVRVSMFRENVLLVDGTVNKRWNGAAAFDLGTIAPTAAPALATAAGPGVTGTYEGYGVWYDPVMDHESSPSATSAQVVFANQARQWTKPAGAPGAEYTHWRIYVRRVDTNELNFYRAATEPIASATLTENTSDTARRDLGPQANDNDPPSAPFAMIGEWNGFGIGVEPDSDEFVVSKQGDLQSWHPKHRFPVNRGSGTPTTTAKPYGEEYLLQKDSGTWRLIGTKVPFICRKVVGSFGNVAYDASMEIGSQYWGWDREKGPYVTDLVTWRALDEGRLKNFLATITPTALHKIRIGHVPSERIVFWAVPVGGASRTRVLLPYQYELDAWLPPIEGLEYSAFCTFTDPTSATLATYAGDEWGRVHRLFIGDRQSVPTTNPMSTLTGTATAATASTITDAGAAFYTTGSGLAGLPVAVRSPAGDWQWRRIASNTGTVLTLDTVNGAPFSPAPAAGWTYYVGGIEWYQWTPVLDVGDPFLEKLLHDLHIAALAPTSALALSVDVRVNGDLASVRPTLEFAFSAGSGGVWGVSTWGSAVWGGAAQRPSKQSLGRTVESVQFRFRNFTPDARVILSAYALGADPNVRRRSVGGA